MCSRFILEDIVAVVFRKGRNPFYSGKHHCLSRLFYPVFYTTRRKYLIPTTSSGNRKWTKQALVSILPLFPRLIACRSYQRDNNAVVNRVQVWRKRLLTLVRGVFLTTGALVWIVALFAYVSLEKVSVNVHEERGGLGLNALENKLMNNFYKTKDEAMIMKKDDALDQVWMKLKEEERIVDIFGDPVYICGYSYSDKIGEDILEEESSIKGESSSSKEVEFTEEKNGNKVEDGKLWDAGCFIEGSKKVGLMNVKFEEHKQMWVPVALHLETLEKSGQVVSDVSGPLPNGIKNFTRLSNEP